MNPLFRIDFSISDSLKIVRKSVLIYETIISGQDLEAEIIARQTEEDFISTLTAYQKEIYICVIRNKESQASFAQRKGVKKQSINENVGLIRKKAKIFWK